MQYISMLSLAQQAAMTAGIEGVLRFVEALAPIDPAAADKIDIDYAIQQYSYLMNNDPRLVRDDKAVAGIRQQRAQQQQQQMQMQQAELAPKVAKAGLDASQIDVGGGQNAFQAMMGRQAA